MLIKKDKQDIEAKLTEQITTFKSQIEKLKQQIEHQKIENGSLTQDNIELKASVETLSNSK